MRQSIFVALLASAIPFALAVPTSKRQSAIPSYVIDYAPLVWLESSDQYAPSDFGAQLVHTTPEINATPVANAPNPLTLDNLDSLNSQPAKVWLTSKDDISKNPSWLNGVVPDSKGKTNGITSCAIIVNDHGDGTVDAFYMYFYAYNQGNVVFGMEIGDHVGDWEHNMVRFVKGVPQAVWYSQHAFGEAFTYEAVEKIGVRPVTYSATGSHANYAIAGTHDHTIPGLNLPFSFVLNDHCDKGKLWDPTLAAATYTYNAATQSFTTSEAGQSVNWLNYTGAWGDEQYPKSDPRQREILGISQTAKYQGGPTGPKDKQLNRSDVCPTGRPCVVNPVLIAKRSS